MLIKCINFAAENEQIVIENIRKTIKKVKPHKRQDVRDKRRVFKLKGQRNMKETVQRFHRICN